MSLMATFKKTHSFFVYLSLSYLAVYAVCAILLYIVHTRVISKSTRAFDRDDIRSESLEYAEILRDNKSGNWLAEEVALENLPPSTLFAIRLLSPDGKVLYAAQQPTNFALPGCWKKPAPAASEPLPQDGWQEIYLPDHKRYLQMKSTRLPDGRVLQVAESTSREQVQQSVLFRTALVFFLLASLFSLGSGLWMIIMTLKPIKQITAEMSRILEFGTTDANSLSIGSPISELNALGSFFVQMNQKNAKLIRAMKDTLDNVAHDFRTPLTRIRSAAEFALNAREPAASREALLRILEGIVDDCDAARIQLQNLLDIRALESGFITLDTQRFDLKNTVSEIADLYTVMAEDKDIELRTELPECDVLIDGDPAQLSQAFANLIDNAVKYTPRGGHIRVTLETTPSQILFTVADSGIGIPEDEHALIWQRLYRSRSARAEKGLGLGMSIVKTIIDAHGGTIALTSTPGHGTTFVVALPPHTTAPATRRVSADRTTAKPEPQC